MSLQNLENFRIKEYEKQQRISDMYIIFLIVVILLLCISLLINNVNAMEYTGDLELCVLDTLGDEICLNNGDSYDINNSRTYYMILQPKNEIRDVGDVINIFYKLFASVFIAFLVILALGLIFGKIMLMRK